MKTDRAQAANLPTRRLELDDENVLGRTATRFIYDCPPAGPRTVSQLGPRVLNV